jgi:hypothetical protein
MASGAGWSRCCPRAEPPGGITVESADHGLGRSRGGLTSKIHLVAEQGQKPLSVVITAGQRVTDRSSSRFRKRSGCPDSVSAVLASDLTGSADRAYDSRENRATCVDEESRRPFPCQRTGSVVRGLHVRGLARTGQPYEQVDDRLRFDHVVTVAARAVTGPGEDHDRQLPHQGCQDMCVRQRERSPRVLRPSGRLPCRLLRRSNRDARDHLVQRHQDRTESRGREICGRLVQRRGAGPWRLVQDALATDQAGRWRASSPRRRAAFTYAPRCISFRSRAGRVSIIRSRPAPARSRAAARRRGSRCLHHALGAACR